MHELIKKTIGEHKRIIFNGNGYDDAWVMEAERRGLLNMKSTPDCLPCYLAEKNVRLFTSHKIFSETEMKARYEIALENYSKLINIEALTVLDMVQKDILPAVTAYAKELASTANNKKQIIADVDCSYEKSVILQISQLSKKLFDETQKLSSTVSKAHDVENSLEKAKFYRESVIPSMEKSRTYADQLEGITAKSFWPFPTYGDILFSVK